LKYVVILLGLALIVFTSFIGTRLITIKSLTDQSSIFDTFEHVNETWLFSDKIGAPIASDLERARVAIGGPLGLSSKEAVYFVSVNDNQGEPLQSHCNYRITGQPIDTRWWSLTLYDSETQHYVPNSENRSSWNSVSIPRLETGEWVVNVASDPQASAWLPSQEASSKSFELMLRVYNPSDITRAALPHIDLPTVERLTC